MDHDEELLEAAKAVLAGFDPVCDWPAIYWLRCVVGRICSETTTESQKYQVDTRSPKDKRPITVDCDYCGKAMEIESRERHHDGNWGMPVCSDECRQGLISAIRDAGPLEYS